MIIDEIKYNILSKFVNNKPEPVTNARRVRDAALMAAGTAFAEILTRYGIKKLPPKTYSRLIAPFIKEKKPSQFRLFNPETFIPNVVSGAILGAFDQDVKNAIIKSKFNKKLKENAIKALKKEREISFGIYPYKYKFEKTSGLEDITIKGIKGIGHLGKVIGYGLVPMGKGKLGVIGMKIVGRKNQFPLSHKIFGLGVKSGIATGAYLGGKELYKLINEKKYQNYTTLLRNNILTGRIQPDELNEEEIEAVKELGLK